MACAQLAQTLLLLFCIGCLPLLSLINTACC
jgi:hypothetical protein